jgi:hypothetical protein
MTAVLKPRRARPVENAALVVVLPTPPLPDVTTSAGFPGQGFGLQGAQGDDDDRQRGALEFDQSGGLVGRRHEIVTKVSQGWRRPQV